MKTALVSTILLLSAVTLHAQTMTPGTITVSGEAQIGVAPDYATVDLGIVTTAKTVVVAARDNAAAMHRLVDALTNLGISNRDVQTSRYSVEAIHPRLPTGQEDESKTSAFSVVNKLIVTTTAVERLAEIIDVAAGAGSNSIQSVTFGIKNKNAAEDEARTEAVKNARHKAEIAAAAENAKVGKMMAMTVGQLRDYGVESVVVTGSRLNATPILPGVVNVSATVTVQFVVQ